MLVGGFAVFYYGHKCYCRHRFLNSPDLENAKMVIKLLREFGFPTDHLTPESFLDPRLLVRMGVAPIRIELFTSLSGIEFDSSFAKIASWFSLTRKMSG
jgi:hypothetical protein